MLINVLALKQKNQMLNQIQELYATLLFYQIQELYATLLFYQIQELYATLLFYQEVL